MGEYIGLDVSMKDTAISVRRDGKRVWRGKCASDPEAIARMVRKHAREPERVIFETGPLSVWFFDALQAEGLQLFASMRVTPKRRWTWLPTRPMPTTQTA